MPLLTYHTIISLVDGGLRLAAGRLIIHVHDIRHVAFDWLRWIMVLYSAIEEQICLWQKSCISWLAVHQPPTDFKKKLSMQKCSIIICTSCLLPLASPSLWSKPLPFGWAGLYRGTLDIHRRRDNIVSPPAGRIYIMQCKGKEDDQCREGEAKVKCRRRKKVESGPPSEVTLLDPVLKDEADDTP